MVQTYQSPVRVYKHPFELVMAAYEKRFPTCPQIPIFVGSEIVFEFHSPDGAEDVIERKCQLNVDAPYFVKKIAGVDYVYFNQKNSLDRRKRTLLIEASNISFASRLIIKENCFYYVHPDNEEWTCFEQSASLDVKSFFGFETVVEKLAVKQYGANLAKGKEVLEFFIDELLKSGVSHVPRWTPPVGDVDPTTTGAVAAGQTAAVQTATSTASDLDSAIDVGRPDDDVTTTEVTKSDSHRHHHQNGGIRDGAHSSASRRDSLSPTPAAEARRPSSASPPPAGSAAPSSRRLSGAGGHHVTRAVSVTHNVAQPPALTASFDDPDEKLETEYIHRVLGPLTPLEESRLCELKYGLRAAHKGKIPNDAHLLRFLRARDFDLAKARDMLLASLLWRKQHNVDKILNDFVPPAVLVKHFPGGWHHHDLEDRPVFVLRLGQMDVKGILRSVGLEAVVKFTLSICEEGLVKAAEATRLIGKPISTWTLLVDLEGLSLRHVWRPGVQSLLRIIETVEAHYPETMGHLLIARAPRVFPVLWTLVSPFINENTRKKFIIHGGGDTTLTEMAKYIDRPFIPDFLGGPCHFDVEAPRDGWLVPKSEYQPIDFEILLRESEQDILTSMYTTVTVHRHTPHEVYVQVPTAGGVITWDFDVVKGECEFVVYFSGKALKGPAPPPITTPSGPVEFVTAAIGASSLLGGGSSAPSADALIAADPQLRLGPELRVVEPTIAFAEGDSMQGSHFCGRIGTYILQWRTIDPHHPSRHATTGESVGTPQAAAAAAIPSAAEPGHSIGGSHKCKLMYYYELLDSEGFRGSVQSLESCRSSFSSLAMAGVDGAH